MILPGAVLGGRYHVQELIARGGMADVFRAQDSMLDRDIAVKAFRVGASDVRRFETEARILARFDHPNLVRVYDVGTEAEQPYVVLQLIPGPTLTRRLEEQGALAEPEARRVATDVSGALAYVHAAGIVHRDVKPSNILLAPDGRAVLGDFGIALVIDTTRMTAAAETVGTAAYLAPEQLTGRDISAAADVYSLGLVLLEALTGVLPFAGTPQEMMAARLARPPAVPASLPAPWPELLTAMTRPDPSGRPAAASIATSLGAPSDALTGIVPPPLMVTADEAPTQIARRTELLGQPAAATPKPSRHRLGWLAGLAALGVVLIAAAVAASQKDREPTAPPATTTTTPTTVPVTTPPPTAAPTTTTTTTTVAPSPAPTSGTAPPSSCSEFEAAKQAIETEKQRIEQQYRNDKKTREALKKQLEEQKRQIEADSRAAGC